MLRGRASAGRNPRPRRQLCLSARPANLLTWRSYAMQDPDAGGLAFLIIV